MNKQTRLLRGSLFAVGACALSLSVVACGADATGTDASGVDSTSEQLVGCSPSVQPVVLATASSQQAAAFAPKYAIDGVATTRWSSNQAAGEQWLQLDLGKVVNVSGLNINWQTAYSKSYVVQSSNDGTNWGTFIISGATKAGVQSVTGSAHARYLRILSREATSWGNVSIIDVQVLGTLDSQCANLLSGPWQFKSENFEPPTFDASSVYSVAGNAINFTYQGKQFTTSGSGHPITFKQPVSVVQGGHYRLRLDVTNGQGATATIWWATLSGAAAADAPIDIDSYSNPSGTIDFDVTAAPGANPTIELSNAPITVFPGVGVQNFTVTATLTKTN